MAILKKMLSWKFVIGLILILIFLGALAVGLYYYQSYQKVLKNPEIVTKQEVDWLQEKIGKIVQVPSDEAPSTATVLDKDKIKDQEFFANAENGDKILIYSKAKKAILYRPSSNKVIEIMPIALDNQQNANKGATTANIKIALYNGSTTEGITNTAETNIKNKIVNSEISAKEKASKTDYKESIVVDISGSKADQAKAIADVVGGTVGALPGGEKKPDADILVILAK